MADYYCENCEFFRDKSTKKLIFGYCKKYNCPLNFYDWWEKCDKCVIDTLQAENAALRARLSRAVKDVAERIENALFCEFADDMTFKMASRIEEVIKAELDGGKE